MIPKERSVRQAIEELDKDDFLTGEDINQIKPQIPNPHSQKQNVFQNPALNIPDLHKEQMEIPLKERKEVMDKPIISHAQLRDELIDERIQQEILSAKGISDKKVSTPRDILKQLIIRGDYQETIDYLGSKWTIRALDQRDLLLASELITEDASTETAKLYYIVFAQVLFSIEAIDGISVYEMFPDIKPIDFDKREKFNLKIRNALKSYLMHFAPQIIDDFYTEYKRIEKIRNDALSDLKNS